MNYKSILKSLSVAGTTLLLSSTASNAAFLYWASTPVKTSSIPVCFNFAYNTMTNLGFSNIQQTPSEVTGLSGGTFASITCIGTQGKATAVVMVVGDNDNETAYVRDNLRNNISRIIRFD
jgi:hypothetical protein